MRLAATIPRLLWIASSLSLLSGCFSMDVYSHYEKSRWDLIQQKDTLHTRLPPERSSLRCAQVGDRLYRIEGAGTVGWLHVPTKKEEVAVLSDQDPLAFAPLHNPGGHCCGWNYYPKAARHLASGDTARTLDLVIGSDPTGFIPLESKEGPVCAMLVLSPSMLQDTAAVPMTDQGLSLIYRSQGAILQSPVVIRTPGYKSRRKAAEIEPLKALYALSVPADIVTSPVQLWWWLFTLPGRAVETMGFGH
ncbi:MAG: hypothetical protein RL318_2405 [Fibrobacterota bacterium]|jgi:hypothetical protein